jgi:hypothetical protein
MSQTPVMLVGSVPLSQAEAVFAQSARYLGTRLKRYPDGETGTRKNWIAWQHSVFAYLNTMETTGQRERDYQLHPPFRLRDGYRPSDIRFPPLGFAREAKASFGVFRRLKSEGVIPAAARFLVAVPTPWAPIYSFVAYADQLAIEPVYERALLAELADIITTIPHAELAVQWDVATEMSWWEGVYPAPFPGPREQIEREIVDELVRLAAAVPADVELGIHLCYGSMNNKHWKDPVDAANLVAVANGFFARAPRQLDYLHLPVPKDRDDDAYFRPLDALARPANCELFLGLLHLDDGVEGARRRIAAAREHVDAFGLACECGLGRVPGETMQQWLALHAAAAAAADVK